jgi:hypothetical protein
MENIKMKRYKMEVGYGDPWWDLGSDEYYADTLEELWDEIYTNRPETIEDLKNKMENNNGYAEDEEDGMWYIQDLTKL